jgi:hypothetical protein
MSYECDTVSPESETGSRRGQRIGTLTRIGLYNFSLADVPVLRGFYTVFLRLVHMCRRQLRSLLPRRFLP